LYLGVVCELLRVSVQTPDEKGDVDPYVEVTLFDPATKEMRRQETSHLMNEPNPKWGEQFDFAMVSAPSILTRAPPASATHHDITMPACGLMPAAPEHCYLQK
jgi:hypothetical protein